MLPVRQLERCSLLPELPDHLVAGQSEMIDDVIQPIPIQFFCLENAVVYLRFQQFQGHSRIAHSSGSRRWFPPPLACRAASDLASKQAFQIGQALLCSSEIFL